MCKRRLGMGVGKLMKNSDHLANDMLKIGRSIKIACKLKFRLHHLGLVPAFEKSTYVSCPLAKQSTRPFPPSTFVIPGLFLYCFSML